MNGEVLKLNSAYMPLGIVSWQEAIELWIKDKAEILDTYEDRILHTGYRIVKPVIDVNDTFIKTIYDSKLDSWKTAFEMPAVIRLIEFVKPNKQTKFYESFTRQNVYIRDNGVCQYCGKEVSRNKFTFDHVIAKSKGGRTCWTNIVCACLECNSKKGDKTLKECGMKLLQKPYAPILAGDFTSGVINRMKGISKIINNKKWQSYLYWNVELKD